MIGVVCVRDHDVGRGGGDDDDDGAAAVGDDDDDEVAGLQKEPGPTLRPSRWPPNRFRGPWRDSCSEPMTRGAVCVGAWWGPWSGGACDGGDDGEPEDGGRTESGPYWSPYRWKREIVVRSPRNSGGDLRNRDLFYGFFVP